MTKTLLAIVAILIILPGCGEKGEKIPPQLLGKWLQETPENRNASPEARMVGPSIDFKSNGTCVVSEGPMQESKSYRIKDQTLYIDGNPPQAIKELTDKRLVIGDGPDQRIYSR